MSKSSNLLKKSASYADVEGVTSAGAHGTTQKASVPVRHSVTEVGISKVNPELEGKELKIGKLLSQDLSVKDKVNPVNAMGMEGVEKEDAVDALLEVPFEWMPENPKLGCVPIRLVSDASEKASSGNKQMSYGTLPKKTWDQNRIEGAEKPSGPSATLDPDASSRALLLLGHPVAWFVAFLRSLSWDSSVLIPCKDWKPTEERRSVLGNTDFHQGLGPHTHQGGAQCTEHYFHKWPWEGQDSSQHVGRDPIWCPGKVPVYGLEVGTF